MFERPDHRRIARILHALDSDLLSRTGSFFGGGTAIVLSLGEYRESRDIDFLCASGEGWRILRNTVSPGGLGALLKTPLRHLREVRADRYGIRTVLEVDGAPIKIEIVSEGRIAIRGGPHPVFGVPTLSREDMYAEKLLANADRGADRSALSRDIIDLAMIIEHWGPIPEAAWDKAKTAYGEAAVRAFRAASALVRDRDHLRRCIAGMNMDAALLDRIPATLEAAVG